MGWLSILFWVITHATELIGLVQAVIKLIKSLPKEKQTQVKYEIEDAIKRKDKKRLKKILEKTKNDSDSAVSSGATIKRD